MTDEQFFNIYGFYRNPPPPKPFAQWKQPQNSRQLASYEQARALVAAINSYLIDFKDGGVPRPMGNGVLPGDDEGRIREDGTQSETSGIYVPSWVGGPAGFKQGAAIDENGVKYGTLLLRFRKGNHGMNVGLFLDKLSRFPTAQDYVVRYLAQEAEQTL